MKYKIIEEILEGSLKTNRLFETYKYFKQFIKDNLRDGVKYMIAVGFHKDKSLMFLFNIEKEVTLIYYSYDDEYENPLFDLNSLPKINYIMNKLKEKKDVINNEDKLLKNNDNMMIKLYKVN